MSEYTDDIINGDLDFRTGEYLGRGGGFQEACIFPKSQRKIAQVAL